MIEACAAAMGIDPGIRGAYACLGTEAIAGPMPIASDEIDIYRLSSIVSMLAAIRPNSSSAPLSSSAR